MPMHAEMAGSIKKEILPRFATRRPASAVWGAFMELLGYDED
jgi:hypothetical protein